MTLDERLEVINQIISASGGFGQTDPLKEDSLENRRIGDACTGYSFQVNNLSYRGVWLSTLEEIRVWVDGQEIARNRLSVELKGVRYPLCTVPDQNETFWGAADPLRIHVNQVGGLEAGEHTVRVAIRKRTDFGHSYGEGTSGYEEAHEFLTPEHITDEKTYLLLTEESAATGGTGA